MAEFTKDFEIIVKEVFAPIYPVIARQIVDRCNINSGNCIDIGCGSGELSLMLAKITDLDIYALDLSIDANTILRKNIEQNNLSSRIKPMLNDVHDMPFDDEFADLIISRGSLFFWDDKLEAFKEIYRVLKPNGMAYIGCGFGTAELFEEIKKKIVERDPQWDENRKNRLESCNVLKMKKILEDAKIPHYVVIDDDHGFWILIKKH